MPLRVHIVEDGPKEASASSKSYLLWVAFPLLVALSGLFKVRDLDVWWRVRTGQWIWEHMEIPSTDPFSYTAEGPWNCVEPLANLFLYACHAASASVGLSLAGALMAFGVGLTAILLAREVTRENPQTSAILFSVGLYVSASNFRFGPKPELFSLCGLALLLLLLHRVDRTRQWKSLLLAPALVLLWALLHRGSTVSIPVIGAAGLVWALRRDTRPLALAALGALTLTLLALALAPGMAASIFSSASVVSTSAYTKYIGEWQPLTWTAIWSTMPALAILTPLWILVAPLQRRLHFGTLVVLGLGFMAMRHARFAPLLALAMVPEVAWGLARLLEKHRDAIASRVRPRMLTTLATVATLSMMAWPYMRRPVTTWGAGLHDYHRPVHAAEFLRANPPPGRMFNTFNYGGYLLYALGPDQKVFIDGRNDQVYRSEFFAQAAVTPGNARVLAHLIESYEVTFAVLQCTQIVNYSYLWLYQHPEWRMVYLDDKAAILVKRTPDSEAYLEKHAYQELRPDTALLRAQAADSDPRHAAFASEVLRNLEEAPHSIRAHYLAALIHKHAGREADYLAERLTIIELAAERRLDIDLP